jgi:hypothetical protein
MNIAEFQDRLDAHGGDLAGWPEEARRAAERLVASDAAARSALDQARRLDDLLAGAAERHAAADQAAAARVLAALPAPLPRQRRHALSWAWPAALLEADLGPARWRLAALAGVAGLGVVLGLFGPDFGDGGIAATASPETTLAALFEAEPLTGVRP